MKRFRNRQANGMKLKMLLLTAMLTILNGCSYSSRVQNLSDEELCRNLGVYTLQDHKGGIDITWSEIRSRNIDEKTCVATANNTIDERTPSYKLQLCQKLAAYHYEGAYQHFKNTLVKIEKLGFADQECNTMADFYYIRLSRKQEKAKAIADALNQAAENMQRNYDRLYGPGTAFNPIHIKIE